MKWKYMHSMVYLRRVINDYYDRKLRDANRLKRHQGVQKGTPGLYHVLGGEPQPQAAPGPSPPPAVPLRPHPKVSRA